MTISSSNKALTVYICYGFAEGRVHGKAIYKNLIKSGYKISNNPKNADIIIAHSAGCWEIPPECDPKLVMYIGMPLPINKAQMIWLKANFHSILSGIKRGSIIKLIRNTLYNIFYIFLDIKKSIRIIKYASVSNPVEFPNAKTLFIVNKKDPWPKSEKLKDFLFKKEWSFISLGGSHDNIWHNSTNYIEIIKQYARLLAKTD